jgi:hypothetical protein
MKEREMQAAVSWRNLERGSQQNANVLCFREAKVINDENRVHIVHLVNSQELNAVNGAQFFKLESLILAQNERWRQA